MTRKADPYFNIKHKCSGVLGSQQRGQVGGGMLICDVL